MVGHLRLADFVRYGHICNQFVFAGLCAGEAGLAHQNGLQTKASAFSR